MPGELNEALEKAKDLDVDFLVAPEGTLPFGQELLHLGFAGVLIRGNQGFGKSRILFFNKC